jgi:hypothetical protein
MLKTKKNKMSDEKEERFIPIRISINSAGPLDEKNDPWFQYTTFYLDVGDSEQMKKLKDCINSEFRCTDFTKDTKNVTSTLQNTRTWKAGK